MGMRESSVKPIGVRWKRCTMGTRISLAISTHGKDAWGMIDILLIELEKYKVISLLKCNIRVFFEQPSRASRASRTTRTSKRCSKKKSKGNPSFFRFLLDFSRTSFGFSYCLEFLLLVGWSQTIGLSREEKSYILGISWRFYISRNIRSHEF